MVGNLAHQSRRDTRGACRLFKTEAIMKRVFAEFLRDESGASLIEYVLIGGIISIVGIVTMVAIGGDIQTIWTRIKTGTGSAATP